MSGFPDNFFIICDLTNLIRTFHMGIILFPKGI